MEALVVEERCLTDCESLELRLTPSEFAMMMCMVATSELMEFHSFMEWRLFHFNANDAGDKLSCVDR